MRQRLSANEQAERDRQPLRAVREQVVGRRPGSLLGAPRPGGPLAASDVLHLQRTVGNAATTAYLQRDDDEATTGASDTSPVHAAVARSGSPVDSSVRQMMEPVLKTSLSGVQVVEDRKSTASVGAGAYTVGEKVVVNPDHFQAGSPQAQRTLAHELTHVKQQRQGPVDGTPQAGGIQVSHPSDRFEQEAERTADAVMAGVQRQTADAAAISAGPSAGLAVQRAGAHEHDEDELGE